MKLISLLPTVAAVLAFPFLEHVANGGEVPDKASQVIILKLDDVTAYGSPSQSPVSPRWQRITDFLSESDINASFGIIGFSLEEDNQLYFDWIKTLHESGLIEFWNHGYRNRRATDKTGEFERSFEEQKVALQRTQRLAKEKLGIELKAFGPHWSGTNEDTGKALEGIPEIKTWFYGPRGSSKFVFERVLTLENPTHVPDFAKFKAAYDRVGHNKKCLALQGHPNSWDNERWDGFVKIIDYLKSKGCVFMTPSEYMEKAVVDEKPIHRKPGRKWEIHLIHQTHLDIGYTHTQQDVLKRQVGFLYTALELIEETRDYPEDARFKWHPEGMWAIDEFLRTATAEKRKEFLDAIRNGSIHLDGFYVHMMTGLGTEEELLRLLQPAKDFEQKYGVRVTTAIGSDVPGYTWGLVSAMGQQGIKYLNTAPNNNHRLGFIYLLGNKPFYWIGPSGQHRVLCWMVPNSYIHFWGGRHRDVGSAVMQFIDHYLVAKDYPYDIAQIRYEIGGDNGHPDPELARQVKEWNEQHAYPKIILSTNTRLFTEFEERYGKDLPVLSGDLTPYWEDGAASTSADLAINRRAKEDLDQAERLWTMLVPHANLHDLFGQAWHNAIMYDEHTWGAHCSISQPFSEFTVSQEKFKQRFSHNTRDVAQRILQQVTGSVAVQDSKTIDLYNTASWDRGGAVLLSNTLSSGGDRLVDAAENAVPTQRLESGELAVIAPAVPAFGAARFTIQSGQPEVSGDVIVEGNRLENEKIRIAIDPVNGSIKSIFSKVLGKELVDHSDNFGVNDFLYTLGRVTGEGYRRITTPVEITIEDAGPIVGTVRIESDAPGCNRLVRRVRIFSGSDRIGLINDMDKKQELTPEGVYFAFPLNVPGGQVRINVPFAVTRPEKDQLPGANRNYYCVERWVDISNDDYGVTWITRDAPMLKFHPFKIIGRGRGCLPAATMMYDKTPDGVPDFWDQTIDPGSFFYSWVMTNHWETNYKAYQEGAHRFAYTLLPHAEYDQAVAQRGAKDVTQPMLAIPADRAKPVVRPLLSIGSDGVIVTSLRPSRDGKATMIRLFAASGQPERFDLKWSVPKQVYRSDPQETRGAKIEAPIDLPAYGVVTLRVEPL